MQSLLGPLLIILGLALGCLVVPGFIWLGIPAFALYLLHCLVGLHRALGDLGRALIPPPR